MSSWVRRREGAVIFLTLARPPINALALERAQEMSALSPAALHAAKCALQGGDEGACFESVWGQADWREGIEALLAKRRPGFQGRAKGRECCDLPGRAQAD